MRGALVLPLLLICVIPTLGYVNVWYQLACNTSTWLLFWGLRDSHDPSRRRDLWLLTIVLGGRSSRIQPRHCYWLPILPAGLIASSIFVFVVGCVFRVFFRPAISEKADTQRTFQSSCDVRPVIHPCRTTHTRIFPTKHSFSYSYL